MLYASISPLDMMVAVITGLFLLKCWIDSEPQN
jgi:hypothetical protein